MTGGWSLWAVPREVWLRGHEEMMRKIEKAGKEIAPMTLDERFERIRNTAIALWDLGPMPRGVEVTLHLSKETYHAIVSVNSASGQGRKAIGRSAEEALTALERDIHALARKQYEHLSEAAAEFDP